jgi:hypothetical protein
VGLNTYMVAGSKKITRYYAYNAWAFNITLRNMQEAGVMNAREEFFVLPPRYKEMAREARTHEDLFAAAGNMPFVQVLPCGSLARPGAHLNGTRLHLGVAKEEGFDFSICSASTAARTRQFHEEHWAAFRRLEQALLDHYALTAGPPATATAGSEAGQQQKKQQQPDPTAVLAAKEGSVGHARGPRDLPIQSFRSLISFSPFFLFPFSFSPFLLFPFSFILPTCLPAHPDLSYPASYVLRPLSNFLSCTSFLRCRLC